MFVVASRSRDLGGVLEQQADRAAVFLRRTVGRVVHLEDELPTGRHQLGHARRSDERPRARGETAQQVHAGDVTLAAPAAGFPLGIAGFPVGLFRTGLFLGRVRPRGHCAEAFGPPACAASCGILAVALALGQLLQGAFLRFDDPVDRLGRSDEDNNVVHHRRIARQALGRADPFVLLEAGVGDVIPIGIDPFRLDVDGFVVHVNDLVGCSVQQPAFGELGRRRQLGGISFGTPGIDPRVNEVLLVVGKHVLVGELAVGRVGVPGRHPLFADDFGNHLAPAGDLVVFRHGERTDLAGPMAVDAPLIQQARNLVRIGDRRIPSSVAGRGR